MKKQNKPKVKHVPMRTCIATGEKRPKSELIRLVIGEGGEVVVDIRSKLLGRGANLSMTKEAFELAIKKRAIPRALKLKRSLTEEEIKELREEFHRAIEERTFRPKDKAVTVRIKKEDLKKILDRAPSSSG